MVFYRQGGDWDYLLIEALNERRRRGVVLAYTALAAQQSMETGANGAGRGASYPKGTEKAVGIALGEYVCVQPTTWTTVTRSM